MDGTTNNSFRIWRFCLITSTHSCSYSPLRIPHVMTYPICLLYRFVCFPIHALSFHLSIHRLCATFWMDVSFDHLYPSYGLFFLFSVFIVFYLCRTFISHYIDVSTLYISAYSNSGLPLFLTPKGLSMLPFHLCLFSLLWNCSELCR